VSEQQARGDHFSSVAANYAQFRPRYPRELFEFVASLAPSRTRVWDCGAGTGQASNDLAEFFDEVIATDVSAQQVAQAPARERVTWHVAPAESAPIADRSIDLIVVAQALHWFDHERFYHEVRRVAVAGGAIAAWTYLAPRVAGDVGERLNQYMSRDVGAYWPAERRYVDDEYRGMPFPFARIAAPPIALRTEWTLDQLTGYLRSMSATARFVAANGGDPAADASRELAAVWGTKAARAIEWPLVVLAGRVE
jgi:ubiquinone/menaquinone biosynthesis C-methylase UbiE